MSRTLETPSTATLEGALEGLVVQVIGDLRDMPEGCLLMDTRQALKVLIQP